MSWPYIVFGPDGAHFGDHAQQRHNLGTVLMLPDGRRYRYTEVGGTNIATARLVQSEPVTAAWDELVTAAAAVGARVINITTGATLIAAGDLDEGYANIEDDAGEGHLYKLDIGQAAIAATTAGDIFLAPGNGLVVALTAATTTGVSKNAYKDVVIAPTTLTARVMGCLTNAINANRFGWAQTSGPASVLTDGTVGIGQSVMPSNGTAGAVEAWGLTEAAPPTEITPVVGHVMELAATTEESLIYLMLD